MFDVSGIEKRYFEIKLTVPAASATGKARVINLEVEPPKLNVMRKISKLASARDEEAIDELAETVKMILSKNKTGYVVSDEIIDELDYDQMNAILDAFFTWMDKSKNSPN